MVAGIDLFGYVAGLLVMVSLVPQVVKSWKTKSIKDISLLRYVFYVTGVAM